MRPEDRSWVGTAMGGRVLRTRRFKGGISTDTRLVVVERDDGQVVRAVHRRIDDQWLAAEPGLVEREAALLEDLEARGVPAPRVIACDPVSGLLMTREPGRPVHRPPDRRAFVAALVDAILSVHAGGPPTQPGYRDQVAAATRDVLEPAPYRHGWNVDPATWAHVARLWPEVQLRPATLIHDDFHPGNVLWSRGRLTSIVDWTTAGVGQAASDICYLRFDVALVLGLDVGDEVLAAYEAAAGEPVPDRPFWDLFAAVRAVGAVHVWHGSWLAFGLRDLPLAVVEQRLEEFVKRAVAEA